MDGDGADVSGSTSSTDFAGSLAIASNDLLILTLGGALAYLVLSIYYPWQMPKATAVPLTGLAYGTAFALIALWFAQYRRMLKPTAISPARALVMVLFVVNSIVALAMTKDVNMTAQLMAAVVVAGCFVRATWRLVLFVVLANVAWLVATLSLVEDPLWGRYAVGVLQADLVAALIHAVRIRALRRLAWLESQHRGLESRLDGASRALREAEDSGRQLLASTTDAIIVHRFGEILYANDRAARLFLMGAADLVDASVPELIAESDQESGDDDAAVSPSFEATATSSDGRVFPVEVYRRPVEYKGRPAEVLSIREISDQKTADRMLQRFDDLTTSLLEGCPLGIVRIDADGLVTEWNAAAEGLFGHSREDALGARAYELISPVARPGDGTARDLVALRDPGSGVPDHVVRTEVSGASEHPFPVEFQAVGRLESGRPGCTVFFRDITEQRQSEATLASAKIQARAATRAKSDFLRAVSHELRTPLNGILGMAGVLASSSLNENQSRQVETIRQSGTSLLRLINDVIEFSELAGEKVDLDVRDMDLHRLLEGIIDELQEDARQKNMVVRAIIDADVPRIVKADEKRLQQVFSNLVGNAIKFSDSGEVILKASSACDIGDETVVLFDIQDKGPGVAQETQDVMFRPFVQGDGSSTREHGGTGLGLAVSRELAELMGGEMGVESEPGKGTTFWFTVRFGRSDTAVLHYTGTSTVEAPDTLGVSSESAEEAPEHDELRAVNGSTAVHEGVADDSPIRDTGTEVSAETVAADDEVSLGETSSVGLAATAAGAAAAGLLRSDESSGHVDAQSDEEVERPNPLMDLPVEHTFDDESSNTTELEPEGSGAKSAPEPTLEPDPAHFAQPEQPMVWQDEPVAAEQEPFEPEATAEPAPSPVQVAEQARTGGALKILVAEDNPVNQEVTKLHLEEFGHSVTIAANGALAVRAFESEPYDLIIMDCQMPEMDGYTATQVIRETEGGQIHTPIIAMTAHSMREDRDRCLEAGMDDYLTKPVDGKTLADTIERWRPKVSVAEKQFAASMTPEVDASANGDDSASLNGDSAVTNGNGTGHGSLGAGGAPFEPLGPAVDASVLAELRAYQREGEDDIVTRLIDLFVGQTADQLEAIRGALQQSDARTMGEVAHALKGASGTVGARRMASISEELQHKGRSGIIDGVEPLVSELEEEFSRVRLELDAERVN